MSASFPYLRMRRGRSSPWMRAMLAENRLHPSDFIWPLVRLRRPRLRGADRARFRASADGASIGSAPRRRKLPMLGIPCVALFPNTPEELRTERRRGSAQQRQSDLPGDQGDQGCRAGNRRTDRRRARSLHGHGHDGIVDDAGNVINDETVEDPRRSGAGSGRSRRGHRRAVRHDGRPRRCDPRSARARGPPECRDHGLCCKICIGLLRPVPRRGRLARVG